MADLRKTESAGDVRTCHQSTQCDVTVSGKPLQPGCRAPEAGNRKPKPDRKCDGIHQPALRGIADHRPIGGAVLRQQISPDARVQPKDRHEHLSLPDAAAAPRGMWICWNREPCRTRLICCAASKIMQTSTERSAAHTGRAPGNMLGPTGKRKHARRSSASDGEHRLPLRPGTARPPDVPSRSGGLRFHRCS